MNVYQKTAKGGLLAIGKIVQKKPTPTKTSVPRRGQGNINIKIPDFS